MTRLKDIADALGLTPVTVSKVLRGKGKISPATRERVIKAAREMNYRPHAMARSMRRGSTGIVGLIYTAEGIKGNLPVQLLAGIQRELVAGSYELMLGEVPDNRLAEPGRVSALLRQWLADGILINNQIGLPRDVVLLVEQQQVPAIWINAKLPRNCVYFDDFAGAQIATEHLLSLGHRRIAYVDYSHGDSGYQDPEHYSVTDRFGGYVAAMRAAGLEPVKYGPQRDGPALPDERVKLSVDWLSHADRPTAVITYGASTAVPVFFAAARMGLGVPKDLSLIDFANEQPYVNDLRLTVVKLNQEQLGARSVQLLLSLIQSGPVSTHFASVPLVMSPGDSCAAVGK